MHKLYFLSNLKWLLFVIFIKKGARIPGSAKIIFLGILTPFLMNRCSVTFPLTAMTIF